MYSVTIFCLFLFQARASFAWMCAVVKTKPVSLMLEKGPKGSENCKSLKGSNIITHYTSKMVENAHNAKREQCSRASWEVAF